MQLTAPRAFFGVHSFTPYSRTDGTPYGILKVLKSSSLSLSSTLVELNGGSSKFPWATEQGSFKSELALKFMEYPDFLFTLFLGKAPTATTVALLAAVDSALANVKGTSVFNATTGIAAAAVKAGSETDVKLGKYLVVAASATTVDVYFLGDADLGRGTNGIYLSDTLKVASALTITTSAVLTTITGFGLTLSGGSGTIGMTIGDTALFTAVPEHSGLSSVRIGGIADQTYPEFGAIVMAEKRGNQELVEIDCFRCKAAGMPIMFDENSWSGGEVKINVMYDPAKDGIFDFRAVKPSGT